MRHEEPDSHFIDHTLKIAHDYRYGLMVDLEAEREAPDLGQMSRELFLQELQRRLAWLQYELTPGGRGMENIPMNIGRTYYFSNLNVPTRATQKQVKTALGHGRLATGQRRAPVRPFISTGPMQIDLSRVEAWRARINRVRQAWAEEDEEEGDGAEPLEHIHQSDIDSQATLSDEDIDTAVYIPRVRQEGVPRLGYWNPRVPGYDPRNAPKERVRHHSLWERHLRPHLRAPRHRGRRLGEAARRRSHSPHFSGSIFPPHSRAHQPQSRSQGQAQEKARQGGRGKGQEKGPGQSQGQAQGQARGQAQGPARSEISGLGKRLRNLANKYLRTDTSPLSSNPKDASKDQSRGFWWFRRK